MMRFLGHVLEPEKLLKNPKRAKSLSPARQQSFDVLELSTV